MRKRLHVLLKVENIHRCFTLVLVGGQSVKVPPLQIIRLDQVCLSWNLLNVTIGLEARTGILKEKACPSRQSTLEISPEYVAFKVTYRDLPGHFALHFYHIPVR